MALGLLNGAFPPERRGWAIGIYGSVTGMAAALGPVLGGAVTQGLGWQWIFWINVPIALAAIPLVLSRLAEAHGPGGRVDLAGLVLVTAAALGLVWGLVRGNTAGWGSPEIIAALAVGVLATAGFGIWQRRAESPMIPPRLLRSRAFSAGNTAIFLLNGSLSVGVFLMPQFQQVVLGQHPLSAGLRLLPWGIPPLLLAPHAGRLADRIGERPLAAGGLLLQAAGLAWIAAIAAPDIGYESLIGPMCIVGIGFSIAIPAVTRSATSTMPVADIGKASGAYSTMRQLGGAFGIAVGGAAFASAGGYLPRQAFSDGFTAALALAAGLALAGVAAALTLPARGNRANSPALHQAAPAASASTARSDR
jgi:EmrB/QacA subfamily drug resistance transporter